MNNVVNFTAARNRVTTGGSPPYDGDMEERVKKLEIIAEKTSERLGAIEKDVAVIKSNYATREDMAAVRGEISALRGEVKAAVAEAKNSTIMWVVSAIFLTQLLPAVAGLVKHFFP